MQRSILPERIPYSSTKVHGDEDVPEVGGHEGKLIDNSKHSAIVDEHFIGTEVPGMDSENHGRDMANSYDQVHQGP